MDISEFPACLMIPPTLNDDGLTASRQFTANHNRAIDAWATDGTLRRNERAILSLATGIHQFITSNEHISLAWGETNDYYACDIVKSLLSAFGDALNYDLGRLDGGTLSEWMVTVHKAVTGEDM